MKKILLASLLALGLTQMAAAKSVSPATKLVKLYTYGDAAVVKIAKKAPKEGCTYSAAGEFLAIDLSAPGGKALYSALLSAFVSGAEVRLASDGCNNVWGAAKSMPEIYRVELRK